MCCGPNCVAAGETFACATLSEPSLAGWCDSGDENRRRHVLAHSRTLAGAAASPPAPRPAGGGFTGPRLLVLGCDYRVRFVGLERDGCGCSDDGGRCLLKRGRWGDRPEVVDYGTCVECVSSP